MAKRGNGEGCITHEVKRNRWRAQYTDGTDENGKPIRRNLYAKTRQEVVERLNNVMYEKAHSMYVRKNGIKLIEVIDSMIEQKYKLNIIQDRQYRTLKAHTKRIKENKIANMSIQKIQTTDIQEFLYTIVEYSQSYIKKLCTMLNSAFTDAIKKRIIYINPMDNVIIPKSKKNTKVVRALTLDEQKKFTNYLINTSVYDEPYRNLFLIQMYMGLRVSEVLALKNTDFDMGKDYLYVRRTISEDKNGKLIMKDKPKTISGIRDLKIPDVIRKYILEQIEISKHNRYGLLFYSKGNTYVSSHGVNSVLKRIFRSELMLDDAEISTHTLRHTFATRIRESQVDMLLAKELLGHSDVRETLNTYTEIQEKYKIKELEKLDEYYKNENLFEPTDK